MKPPKLYGILQTIIFLLIFITCKDRESNNPFDTACPKEIFTPSDLKAEQQGASVKLTWKQTNTNIGGFVISRNENDGAIAEVAKLDKTFSQWNDENIVADKKYGYQLFAYAGENLSNMLVVYCTPINKTIVTTDAVSGITSTSAVLGGNSTNDSGIAITERGVCYGTNLNPTTAEVKAEMGSGSGAFSLAITGLKSGITYYARAYAITKQGTTYGSQVTFTTSFLTVTPLSHIVSKDGGSNVFTVASNIDWQVSTNQSWCAVSVNNGKNNGSITATYTENKEVPQRTATITFTGTGVTSQSVTLTQAGTEPPALTISPANQNLANITGTTTFTISSNVAWTATIDQTWCKISSTSGTGNTTITVTYEANTTNLQRIATLSVTGLGLIAKTVTVNQKSAIPTDGLVAYYPFNGNANDESGNNNNSIPNSLDLTTDRFNNPNKAYAINAKSDYLDIPDFSTTAISVSIWYYFEGLGGNYNTILCRNGVYYHHLLINPNYEIGFFNYNGYGSGKILAIGKWYHLVLIKNGSISKLYIDNLLVQNATNSFDNKTYPFSIIGNAGSFDQGALGKIDDIRIYNRALSETEIQQLYNE